MQKVFIKDIPDSGGHISASSSLSRARLSWKSPFLVIGKMPIMHVAIDSWRLILNLSVLNSLDGGGAEMGNRPSRCFVAVPLNFCLEQNQQNQESCKENVPVTIVIMLISLALKHGKYGCLSLFGSKVCLPESVLSISGIAG